MSNQKPTFEITIATNVRRKMLWFQEKGDGRWAKISIADMPKPLLHLLEALDEGKRVKINLAEVIEEKDA